MASSNFNVFRARIGLLVFTLFLTGLLVLILSRIWSLTSIVREIDSNSVKTQGKVIAVDAGPNRHEIWTLTVEYKDSRGFEHRIYPRIWFHWFGYPSKGDLVEVVYHRAEPAVAMLDGLLDRWGPALEYGFIAVVLIWVILFSAHNAIFGSVDRLKSLTGYWDGVGKR